MTRANVPSSVVALDTLVDMMSYARPEGSRMQQKFCNRYLYPVFGEPDPDGNFILHIGQSRTVFAAHHDTVDRLSMRKTIVIDDQNIAHLPKGTNAACLGADCTTGVWIILRMIEANIPGIYIIHAGEEKGCIGSRALVLDYPEFLKTVDRVISFDRMGYDSIITHQMGRRTCSDKFATWLGEELGLGMKPDDTGSYTDSEVYADVIPECTNVSVGYNRQHSTNEYQDLDFAAQLAEAVLTVDWENSPVEREPGFDDYYFPATSTKVHKNGTMTNLGGKVGVPIGWENWDLEEEESDFEELIRRNPAAVANLLKSIGYDAISVAEEIGVADSFIQRKGYIG